MAFNYVVSFFFFSNDFAWFLKPQFGGGLKQNHFRFTVAFKVNLISYLISVTEESTDSRKGKRLICSVGLLVE